MDFSFFADVAATDFPIEHWFESNIRAAFASIGNTCCIDSRCLTGADYSNIRVVLKLAHHGSVPHKLIVRNGAGGLATVVDLHVVRIWSQPSYMPDPYDYDFTVYGFAPPGAQGAHPPPPAPPRASGAGAGNQRGGVRPRFIPHSYARSATSTSCPPLPFLFLPLLSHPPLFIFSDAPFLPPGNAASSHPHPSAL